MITLDLHEAHQFSWCSFGSGPLGPEDLFALGPLPEDLLFALGPEDVLNVFEYQSP
jgi:hypothetical protein